MDMAPKRFADTVVLALAGRIDHASAESFKDALRPHLERCAAGQEHLVIDLERRYYSSSAGRRVLMLARKQAKAQGGTLVVAGLTPVVKEIFEIGRFPIVFEVFGSVREALARISPDAIAAFDAA